MLRVINVWWLIHFTKDQIDYIYKMQVNTIFVNVKLCKDETVTMVIKVRPDCCYISLPDFSMPMDKNLLYSQKPENALEYTRMSLKFLHPY